MKTLTPSLLVGISSLLFATTAFADAFADFRTKVQLKIPSDWVCSEIRTLEGRTLFEVSSKANRFAIVITRRELISQQEWTSRFARTQQAVDSIMANEKPDQTATTALLKGLDLPDGRFGGTAMSIDRSEPDIWYPEMGTDDQKSEQVLKTIQGLVDLYEKSEQAGTGQSATRPESKSEGSDKPQPEAEGRSR